MTNAEQIKIPEGYKQTEIGVIPVEWGLVSLSTLIDKNRHIRYGIVQPGRRNPNGCLMLRSQDYSKGWRGTDGMHRVEKSLEEQFDGARLKAGDLVITLVGAGVGQIVAVPDWIEGTILSRSTGRIAVDSAKAYNKYVLHFMSSLLGREQVLFNIKEGAQPVVSSLDVGACLIPYPDIKEQTAIANALSDVDNLIAALETLIAKKSAIKTAAMQQLLTGKKRLPGFIHKSENKAVTESGQESKKQGSDQLAGSGTTNQAAQPKTSEISASLTKSAGQTAPSPGYKQTELGEIPEDWEVKALGELCSYQNGTALEKYFNHHDGYKVISIGNYSETGRFVETNNFIDCKHDSVVRKFVLNKNDLSMILNDKTAVGTIIGRVLLVETDDSYVINQRSMRLTPNSLVLPKYLHLLINSNFIHKNIVGLAKPGTQIYVNTDDVTDLPLILPKDIEEQTAIANVLSDMDTELDALQQRLNKTKTIKQGMMQELLTGKTRLV